jgi:hypothetical protein
VIGHIRVAYPPASTTAFIPTSSTRSGKFVSHGPAGGAPGTRVFVGPGPGDGA